MSSPRIISKRFNDFAGLDLRRSNFTRPLHFSPELLNADIVRRGVPNNEKRVGGKIVSSKTSAPYLGMWTYRWTDSDTGEVMEEIIGLDEHLRRRVESTFEISYAGAANSALISFYLDPTTETFKFFVDEDGTVTEVDVGTGLEGSPVDMASAKTLLEAITGVSVTITGTTTEAAALLPLIVNEDFKTSSLTLKWWEWEQVNYTTTDPPFDLYESKKSQTWFELATMRNYLQSAYFGAMLQYLMKYDGQTVYRAGLPESAAAPSAALASGSWSDTAIFYRQRFVQKDNRGVTNYGPWSDDSAAVSPSTQSVDVTVRNIVAGTGFNTNCCLWDTNTAVAPSGGVVTLNVSPLHASLPAPHTLKAGDAAYFFNTHASVNTYKEYVVASVTTTTISLTTDDTVSTSLNSICSNNLRIEIARNVNGGDTYYSVAEIPNNSFAATQDYNDDGTYGAVIEFPRYRPNALTIKPKYIEVHQGVLVASGDAQYPEDIWLGDIENPEGFPTSTHTFTLASNLSTGVSGLKSIGDSLVAFKERGVFLISGDMASLSFSSRKVHEGFVGCISNSSIGEVRDGIVFLTKEDSFYLLRGGYELLPIGLPLAKLFKSLESSEELKLRLKRAVAFVDGRSEKYLCYIPRETTSGSDRYPTDDSIVCVLDYQQELILEQDLPLFAWLLWNNVNMASGMCEYGDEIFWASRVFESSAHAARLWRRHDLGLSYDYEDHHQAIRYLYSTQWDDEGEPSVFKKALRFKMYSEGSQVSDFTLKCRTERDHNEGLAHSSWEFVFGTASESGGGGYGVEPYGVAPYGSPVTGERRVKLRTGKHKSIRYVFENETHNENVAISGYEYEKAGPYEIQMKE